MINRVVLVGRLTKDVELRKTNSNTSVCSFTLACNRRFQSQQGGQTADFINCVAFGKTGEFLEKYARKGTKFVVEGRIQTGSYTNKEGQKVYTTDVVCENVEFAESKNSQSGGNNSFDGGSSFTPSSDAGDGFMNIPDGIDEELPFN